MLPWGMANLHDLELVPAPTYSWQVVDFMHQDLADRNTDTGEMVSRSKKAW